MGYKGYMSPKLQKFTAERERQKALQEKRDTLERMPENTIKIQVFELEKKLTEHCKNIPVNEIKSICRRVIQRTRTAFVQDKKHKVRACLIGNRLPLERRKIIRPFVNTWIDDMNEFITNFE